MAKKKENKNFAVGYCRFSSDNQREESIDAQKRAINKYADEHGLVIAKWYVDEACSAKTARRPDFQQMIQDSKSREFNTLLIYKIDRFSRDEYDMVYYKRILKLNGVKIVSVCENIDDSPQGQMLLTMLEGFAVYYSRNLSNEVRKGMNENAYNAKCNGGIPPYGYKRVPRIENGNIVYSKKGTQYHDTVIDPQNAEAVKLIFNMTLAGESRSVIRERLNELGFRDSKGREFTNNTFIDNIVRNERYTGVYIFNENKTVINENGSYSSERNEEKNIIKVEGGLPQIITKETFNAVQKILQQRVHRSPAVTKEEYLLSGKIICGECGKTYQGWKKTQNGVSYIYYKCCNNGQYYKGALKENFCTNSSVQRNRLEEYVIKQLTTILSDPNLVDNIYDEYNLFLRNNKSNLGLIDSLNQQLTEVNKQINNIVGFIANGNYNDIFSEKLTELENKKILLENTINEEKNKIGELTVNKQELQTALNQAIEILQNQSADFTIRKTILQTFLNKIIVYKNHIEIYFNLIPAKYSGNFDLDIEKRDLDRILSGEKLSGAPRAIRTLDLLFRRQTLYPAELAVRLA